MTEIQKGLMAELVTFKVNGVSHSHYNIHSSEGYCFWERLQPENYDEKGELLPLEKRVFSRFAVTSYKTIAEINEHFISVPIESNFVIS